MTGQDSTERALSQLIVTVFRLNGAISSWGDRLGEPLELSTARWQAMGAIRLAGTPLTAPQIARAMGLTRQGVQKQLNFLLEKGFVERRRNPLHERSHLYELTEAGDAVYGEILERYTSQSNSALAGLDRETLVSLQERLQILTDNIETLPARIRRQGADDWSDE
ncbi:MAG: MarR family winged helix-turn-helix transcriptional regulator [Desulfovibrionaceae bacterium]|nr:MarR family winged helix-turn-helix transcriptional regulator [Desulfovibrionaceae bacterium]